MRYRGPSLLDFSIAVSPAMRPITDKVWAQSEVSIASGMTFKGLRLPGNWEVEERRSGDVESCE
jgi:hypothetical protein